LNVDIGNPQAAELRMSDREDAEDSDTSDHG